MAAYNFNNTEVELKDTLCKEENDLYSEMKPQVNLYVRVGNRCNARCKFCTYHGEDDNFDFDVFERALIELKHRDILGKIQLTGGEPSLYGDRLFRIVNLIRKYFPNNFISINTNGSDLESLLSVSELVNNYCISRHHYDENKTEKIFGTTEIPSNKSLQNFIQSVGNTKVHMSCNLIKGYIDNIDEIRNYLDFCSSIGCNDIGFVTLMSNNDYSIKHSIELVDMQLESELDFVKYRQFNKCDGSCRCANYLYTSRKTGTPVDVYGRYVCNQSSTVGQLSFSGDTLRVGFTGEMIKI